MKTRTIIIFGLLMCLSLFLKTPSYSQVHQHEPPAKETSQPQNQAATEAVQEESPEEAPAVEIEPEKQQLIGVRIFEVAAKPMKRTIRTVGRIEYDERKLATVNTKFEGWIEKLYVDYTGRYVKQGEPLAEIYSPELYATQQEFLNLLKWVKPNLPAGQAGTEHRTQNIEHTFENMLSTDAERIVDASRQRLKLWDISDEQIEKIKESGKPVRTLTIYSPANGYVTQKLAVQGMRVMPGEKLFDITDLSTLWVLADIYEYEMPFVKPGQKAKISLSYFPGKEFTSTIDYVYPSISGATRTATVRFEIPNYKGQLKPQMFTEVEIKLDLGSKLSVPDDSIIDTGIRQIVYVDKGEGYFEPREIMPGMKAGGFTEVLMGLKKGEKVASSATFLIDSEAQLKGVTPLGGHKH